MDFCCEPEVAGDARTVHARIIAPARYTEAEIQELVAPLKQRIAELEAKLNVGT